jgi:hypothetical protein
VGMAWRRGTGHGNAGEVRQGSEAKGNAGRVEVRQARSGRSEVEWKGGSGMARLGVAGTV